MSPVDIVRRAWRSAFRSKLRTALTVLAIVVGAFTLTLTTAIGAGINGYVSDTVASVGVDNVMTVMHEATQERGSGPAEYDPDAAATVSGTSGAPAGAPGAGTVAALTQDDLAELAAVPGVLDVQPNRTVSVDYVQHADGTRYQLSLAQFLPGMHVELSAGEQLDLDTDEAQLVLPEDYVEPLGFASAQDAVGQEVTLAVTDAAGTQATTTATVVGVAEPGLIASAGAVPNDALVTALDDLARVGSPAGAAVTYGSASVFFDPDSGTDATTALQDRLADLGYSALTLDDQLGTFTSVIDVIVFVLSAFAAIALVAAAIGIVNTLYMAVQERTREIGLMKAMGLSSAKVFSLFSVEAVVIGLLGSLAGVVLAMLVGSVAGAALAGTILSNLAGLTLFVFQPLTVAGIVLAIMAIAFLAGTLPAVRAARSDPIESLRYE